jgi:hypothetical protein
MFQNLFFSSIFDGQWEVRNKFLDCKTFNTPSVFWLFEVDFHIGSLKFLTFELSSLKADNVKSGSQTTSNFQLQT